MPALSPAALRTQIASGETGPLYLLVGADAVETSAMADEFEETVDEGLRAFNVDRLHGGETRVDDLIQAAATLPMMAPKRLIVVLEGEKLLVLKRESKAADEDMERLEAFLKSPPSHATTVFVCSDLDQRRRTIKLLIKEAQVVNCGTIADAADAERWVKARATAAGLNLDPAAARALVERAGIDVPRLRAGLDRLALYGLGQPKITAEDVRQAVSAGPEAQENFGIANAVQRNDAAEALHQLGLALDSGAQAFFVLGQLRTAAERLPAPRLKNAIDAVFRTDLALKASGGEPRILLERLVVELCASRRRA